VVDGIVIRKPPCKIRHLADVQPSEFIFEHGNPLSGAHD
jgi:hypothetical protein